MNVRSSSNPPGFGDSGLHRPTLLSSALLVALGIVGWNKIHEEPVKDAFETIQNAYHLSQAEIDELRDQTSVIARRDGKALAVAEPSQAAAKAKPISIDREPAAINISLDGLTPNANDYQHSDFLDAQGNFDGDVYIGPADDISENLVKSTQLKEGQREVSLRHLKDGKWYCTTATILSKPAAKEKGRTEGYHGTWNCYVVNRQPRPCEAPTHQIAASK